MDTAITLLDSGREAFPAILAAIRGAERSIDINMFIWRDDAIGNEMAEAVLAAAERGCDVRISVDRYGVVLEKAEECMRSFFHKRQSPIERLKSRTLARLYPTPGMRYPVPDEESPLYRAVMAHPRIRVEHDVFKADHSKFYVIDEKILFLGGVNIEDKENGADRHGRVYGDLMVRLCGEEAVARFYAAREGRPYPREDYAFPLNRKTHGIFEMEEHYLTLIREAERELFIAVPYLSPLPRFIEAIGDAARRGVAVTLLLPERANFQNDTNRKTARRLLRACGKGITVYLSPKMLHTKAVLTERAVSFGSANITKKAFCQLDELNLAMPEGRFPLTEDLRRVLNAELSLSRRVVGEEDLDYCKLVALMEGAIV